VSVKDESAELKRRERFIPYLKPGENLLEVKFDTLRKREDRNEKRAVKDRQNLKQQDQLQKEAASKDQWKIEAERRELLLQELQPQFLAEPDEEFIDEAEQPIPGTSWKKFVIDELDLYLRPLEKLDFEEMYWTLARSKVGVLVLNMFGVDLPLVLPDGWHYMNICREIMVMRQGEHPQPQVDVWEFNTVEELLKKGEDWDRVYAPGKMVCQAPNPNTNWIQRDLDSQIAHVAGLKQAYFQKMNRLRATYIEARKKYTNRETLDLKIDPPSLPVTPQIELAAPHQLPAGHQWHVTKTSDWPRTQ
jgi:hypothetical protein